MSYFACCLYHAWITHCCVVLGCKLSISFFFSPFLNVLLAVIAKLSFLTISSHTKLMRKICLGSKVTPPTDTVPPTSMLLYPCHLPFIFSPSFSQYVPRLWACSERGSLVIFVPCSLTPLLITSERSAGKQHLCASAFPKTQSTKGVSGTDIMVTWVSAYSSYRAFQSFFAFAFQLGSTSGVYSFKIATKLSRTYFMTPCNTFNVELKHFSITMLSQFITYAHSNL